MRNLGSALSTGEGWSVLLLVALVAASRLGWIPSELQSSVLDAEVSLLASAVVFAGRKAGRQGSTPFVQDGHTVSFLKDEKISGEVKDA